MATQNDVVFHLIQLKIRTVLSEPDRVRFASSLQKENAAVLWCTPQAANGLPQMWAEFETVICLHLIHPDHHMRARDVLRKCRQTEIVSGFISKCRNAALFVEEISDGENWERFVEAFNPQIAFKERKDKCIAFQEAEKLALRIEADAQEHAFQSKLHYTHTGPTLMDVISVRVSKLRRTFSEERKQLTAENECFGCKKVGC